VGGIVTVEKVSRYGVSSDMTDKLCISSMVSGIWWY